MATNIAGTCIPAPCGAGYFPLRGTSDAKTQTWYSILTCSSVCRSPAWLIPPTYSPIPFCCWRLTFSHEGWSWRWSLVLGTNYTQRQIAKVFSSISSMTASSSSIMHRGVSQIRRTSWEQRDLPGAHSLHDSSWGALWVARGNSS